jgi:hypothetical protein
VESGWWDFQIVALHAPDPQASFSQLQIEVCKAHGMKPVCDHPNLCWRGKWQDKNSVYIGQDGHLSYPPHRDGKTKRSPGGFDLIRNRWEGVCTYTSTGNEQIPWPKARPRHMQALCNIPATSHSWQVPRKNLRVMCGKKDSTFAADLEAKNGVNAGKYEFEIVKLPKRPAATYSLEMIKSCAQLKMKPVCDHRSVSDQLPTSTCIFW